MRDYRDPCIDLNGAVVMVTGGTGSFGQAFVQAVVERFEPRKLIVFSRDELKQYEMSQRFNPARYPFMRYFIGDIRDLDRLEMAMRDVEYLVHAAALKHVLIAEYNPFECVRKNIMGAEYVVQAAIRRNVKRVIALSTDKAANPTSLYGATKLASDKIFVAANNLSGADGCRFSVVRYGNVVGSRGGVFEHYKRLIADNAAALPVTDPRMTRFWITAGQGVNFVLSSLAQMSGGEIFVPKIPSMNMMDFAAAVAPDKEIELIGIRPGEKLHEVMISEDDARNTVELADRYVILPAQAYWGPPAPPPEQAQPVAEDFRYASNSNCEWLDAAGLNQLLKIR